MDRNRIWTRRSSVCLHLTRSSFRFILFLSLSVPFVRLLILILLVTIEKTVAVPYLSSKEWKELVKDRLVPIPDFKLNYECGKNLVITKFQCGSLWFSVTEINSYMRLRFIAIHPYSPRFFPFFIANIIIEIFI